MALALIAFMPVPTDAPSEPLDGATHETAGGASSYERAGPTSAQRLRVDTDASYGASTAPASMIPGAEILVEVRVGNLGLRTWPAEGAGAVRLSYHWYDSGGTAVVWDGHRGSSSSDVRPARHQTFVVPVRAPDRPDFYTLAWDLVEDDGAGWFSSHGVAMKGERVRVGEGLIFYGKGWGHGIGLSQWGAQGWAQGAAGVRLSGEQIVMKYFPGAKLDEQPITKPFRVLISSPSTGCVGRTIYDDSLFSSPGGMWLTSAARSEVVYAGSVPDQPLRAWVVDSTLYVRNEWSGAIIYAGSEGVALLPRQSWDPIRVAAKGLAYRGQLRLEPNAGAMRVVNYVSSDDYMQGTLPSEMPAHWEFEALRAQAITARTYAAWRQSTAGGRTWDVRDDVADQCYGGHSHETARSTAAVAATAGTILTHAGQPIRALYSSSHGGISENVGCLLDVERVGSTWKCRDGWPYLAVARDPAEVSAYDRRGRNPNEELWTRAFSGETIRAQILEDYGIDIGTFASMEFLLSPGGRPVAVRIRGSLALADLPGDRFLRTTLGMRSTLVRTEPF